MIIAIAGQKGGTGKSTIAVALASELFQRGFKILLIDADSQGTARTWGEVAADLSAPAPTIVAMGANMAEPGQLTTLAENFDVTFVDCPGRDGRIQRAALLISDLVLLPCGPSAADAWAMAESVEVVREAKTLNRNLRPYVALTKKNSRTVIGKQARESLSQLDIPILKSELGFRVAYQEFLAAGLGLAQYAPRDRSTHEIQAMANEVLQIAGVADVREVANG